MVNINTLYQGDCLEVMQAIDAASVDMILCDLPYGITACKWDIVIPFEPLWEQYKRIIKPHGAIVLTANQPFTSALVMSNPNMFRHVWVWDKIQHTGHLLAKIKPLRQHEDILVFGIKGVEYYPIMRFGKTCFKQRKRERKSKSLLYGNHHPMPSHHPQKAYKNTIYICKKFFLFFLTFFY